MQEFIVEHWFGSRGFGFAKDSDGATVYCHVSQFRGNHLALKGGAKLVGELVTGRGRYPELKSFSVADAPAKQPRLQEGFSPAAETERLVHAQIGFDPLAGLSTPGEIIGGAR